MPILGTIASSTRQGQSTISGSYEPIAVATVPSGGLASVTFGSIPQTYTHLQLRVTAKQTTAAAITTCNLYFNNDTTNTNYARHELYGNGSSVVSSGIASGSNNAKIVFYAGNGTQFGSAIVDILDYTNTNKNTTVRSIGGVDDNGSGYATFTSGVWLSTAAITQMDITFTNAISAQYSSFALYGIKGA